MSDPMWRNVTVVLKDESQITHGKVLEIGLENDEFTLRTPSKILRYHKDDMTRVIDQPADQLYEDIETKLEDIEKRLGELENG
jgi:hypothetical protein